MVLQANKKYSFMTTIKLAVLRHTRAKDGTFKIRISIGHKSETHYIVTKYRVNSLANFVNGTVVGQPDAKAINIKLRQLLNEYDEKLERIPNPSDYTCEQLRNLLRDMRTREHNFTFQQVSSYYIAQLVSEKRDSTAKLMQYHIQRFLDYNNGDVFLDNITPQLIDNYSHHLRTTGASPSYHTLCLAPVRTVVNYAQKMQYVRYDVNPFAYVHRQQSTPRDSDLSVEDMRLLFAFRPARIKTRRTLDLFKLSYLLGGMNMKDILVYDFRDCDTISYIRQKTKGKNQRPTKFTTPSEAKDIIQRLMNKKTGHIEMQGKGDYHSFLTSVNRSLKHIAKEAGLSRKDISFYSARKSFVQHGFDLGISLEVLEYCTGQTMKSNRPIYNYYKVMARHADDAMRKILEHLKENSPNHHD